MSTPAPSKGKGKERAKYSPSRARGRTATPDVGVRSASAGARIAADTSPIGAPRLVRRDPPSERLPTYSPPAMPERPSPLMFVDSDDSSISTTSLSGSKPKAEPSLPQITLVYEGRGGTFYCGSDAKEKYTKKMASVPRDATNRGESENTTDYFLLTNAIGTQAMVTCVGLFFRIGVDRLFFAHMDICKDGVGGYSTRILDSVREDGEKVKNAIFGKLHGLARKQGWSPAEVVMESVTVVCLQTNTTALAVRNGVAAFLKIKDPRKLVIHNWGGFVVEGGHVTTKLKEGQGIHGYENSTFTNHILADKWRYMVDKAWDISPKETVKGM